MSLIEIAAALLGVACVALVVRRSVWNYPFGIVSVALYATVFFRARLYSDAALQLFFLLVNAWGWRHWARVEAAAGEVVVERLSTRARFGWALGCAAATAGWGAVMRRYTDASYPWPDAGIAIVSIAAQILMARRRWENWLLWIAVDLASVPLYVAKGLEPTAILYVLYLILAVWGLADWTRARRSAGPVVA